MPDAPIDGQALLAMMPLAGTLGIELDSVSKSEVQGRLAWSPQLCTAYGVLHGGTLVSFADSMAGICAFVNLPEGASTSTIELKVNFFAAVRNGTVLAVARPLHRGRSVIVVQTDLYWVDDDQAGGPSDHQDNDRSRRHVGQVTQSQAVLQ